MNIRLTISLVLAGTLAYACGPRARSSDPVSVSLSGAPSRPSAPLALARVAKSRGVTASAERANLDARLDVRVAPSAIRFAFNLTNAGPKHVELRFSNGQAYDFVVVDSIGREVWRWGSGRMFTQTVRNRPLGKGESMIVGATLSQPIPAGRYTAIATLTSSNYPVEQRAEFVVGEISIASKH